MLWSMMRLIFKTSSVTPDFFHVFNLILSFSACSESFEKICAWELLGANVLKMSYIIFNFTIAAEIHVRSLANFYCQYTNRRMNLKFMRRVNERERAIRQFVIVKNKLMSVFNASALLLIMNFVITLSK